MPKLSSDERRELPALARGTNRYRLTPEEIELIESVRDTGAVPPGYMVNTDKALAKATGKLQDLGRKYRVAIDALNDSEKALETALKIKAAPEKTVLKIKAKTSSKKSETIPILNAADWHYGNVVDPETVNGLNEYNKDIAKESIGRFFENAAHLINLMTHQTTIKTIVLALLGDLIGGNIHADLRENNDATATEASIDVRRAILNGVAFLLDETTADEIIVPCSIDNHGRDTREIRHATAWKRSYSFLLYANLSLDFEKDSRVKVRMSKGYHNYIDLFGKYKLRFHHGHAFKYGGGVGGITIPVNKKVDKWNRASPVDMDIFGHFHQFKFGGHWVCSPCMVGYDPFAISIGAEYEPPMQLLVGIEKNKGLTKLEPILLGDRSKSKALR